MGSKSAVTLCGLLAMVATMFIGSEGIPPWGPMFGALALISGAQFLLVCTYDLGPNSDPGTQKSARPPLSGQAS
jgi:peptidoglycan/LPS O-acetylase OafA/YrhL